MRGVVLLTILFGATMVTPPVQARLQPAFICWESDMEFPVDCEEDD